MVCIYVNIQVAHNRTAATNASILNELAGACIACSLWMGQKSALNHQNALGEACHLKSELHVRRHRCTNENAEKSVGRNNFFN
jgi:hypothetical protein